MTDVPQPSQGVAEDIDIAEQSLAQLITDIRVALASNGSDHLLVQENSALDVSGATVTVTDDGNFDITADTDIDVALQSEAGDEIRTRVFGPDAGGTLQQVVAEELGTAVANTDVGLLTYLARALSSRAQDEVRVDLVTDSLGGNLDVDVAEQTSGALDVSGATVTIDDDGSFTVNTGPLDGALGSNATDHLLVQENSALDVSGATVTVADDGSFTIDETTQGTLPVEQQTPVQLEDSSGTNIDPRQQGGYAVEYNNVDLNSGTSTTLYAPTNDAEVAHVSVTNPGTTAELQLEVTTGSGPVIIDSAGPGEPINFSGPYYLDGGTDALQVTVSTVEGDAETGLTSVSRSEL